MRLWRQLEDFGSLETLEAAEELQYKLVKQSLNSVQLRGSPGIARNCVDLITAVYKSGLKLI